MKTIEQDGLFFNFCYVGNNAMTWKKFAKEQLNNVSDETLGGLNGFIHSLSNVDRAHVWIAYVSSKKPSRSYFVPSDTSDVEMVMTVTTSEKSCFSMHMGIFRSQLYKGEKHPNLSMKLHAFAAKQLLDESFESQKTYMITVPLAPMQKIMQAKFLEKGKPLYIGDSNSHPQSVISMDCTKKHNTAHHYLSTGFQKLVIKENQDVIMRVHVDDEEMMRDMAWFLDHPDTLDNPYPFVTAKLIDLCAVGGFLDKEPGVLSPLVFNPSPYHPPHQSSPVPVAHNKPSSP